MNRSIGKRIALATLVAVEVAAIAPDAIPLLFDPGGFVRLGELH